MSNFKKLCSVYIVGLHLLLAVILIKSDFIEKIQRKLGVYQKPELSAYFYDTATVHGRLDGSLPEGVTLFIGDSITQGLATAAIVDSSVNYGIGSDTTVGVIERLPSYKSINKAKAVVLAIGVNDLKRRDVETTVDNYQKMLKLIPQDKPIVVSAVLPVDERVYTRNSNDSIKQLNTKLKTLVAGMSNIVYVDSTELLQEPDGNLKAEFHTGDGIHLNTAGYQVWIAQLRQALAST